ncbi:MAG: class I SAM-dependent methyltransferase [Promethearchaeota archaeon]|jgi:SAM-dependent methyltransferase
MNLNGEYDFNIKKNRPEEDYEKVSDYFRGDVLNQYASSKSMMRIQQKITKRALELLNLENRDVLILDAGCGPGFASIYLKDLGYKIVALDLILEFLTFYDISDLNPVNSDMCFPPFRLSTFDGIISISALQWVYRNINDKLMILMLKNLFKAFFQILKPKSMAVMQFYPKNKDIMDKIGKIITNHTDFEGNFIIDNPNSQKKRRIFLLLNKKS